MSSFECFWESLVGDSLGYRIQMLESPAGCSVQTLISNENLYGQFATVSQTNKGTYIAARDTLGIAKMFYTHDQAGKLIFSSRFDKLLDSQQPIYALPRGKCIELADNQKPRLISSFAPNESLNQTTTDLVGKALGGQDKTAFATLVEARLKSAFSCIRAAEDDGFTIFVALSGGLDSSAMASFASRFCRAPIAVTLDLGSTEDAEKARLIAAELGLKHCVFETAETEIIAALEKAPVLCQDYRDFNVHCAALNILLAKNIANWANANNIPASKRIVITGDLMNEYLCDYEEEIIDEKRYYRLPRVPPKMLQRHLIGGLDTSDRELGPFGFYDLICVQPYALVHDLYEAIPEHILSLTGIKGALNGPLVPSAILNHIPQAKLRAQVGDKQSMGVLGICHMQGITESDFKLQLLGQKDQLSARIPILMGRYAVESL